METRKQRILFLVIGAGSLTVLLAGLLAPASDIKSILIGCVLLVLIALLVIFTPQIASLAKDNPKVKTLRRMNLAAMGFVALVFGAAAWLPASLLPGQGGRLDFLLMAGLVILIGNVAPKLPFNRYTGLRLPWTVRDEATWRIAHRVLGYTAFPIALALLIGMFAGASIQFGVGCIIAWVAIPGLYSLWFYLKSAPGQGKQKG